MKRMKKVQSVLLVMLMLVGVVFSTNTVQAARVKPHTDGFNKIILCYELCQNIPVYDCDEIVSVVSDDPSVVEIESFGYGSIGFFTNGAGTANLTIEATKDGETYTLVHTVKVVKEKPFKYIKYGDQNIYKNNEFTYLHKGLKSGKKLTWKLKKGYKFEWAFKETVNVGGRKEIKNGSKIKISSNERESTYVRLHIVDKEGNLMLYNLFLQR